MIFKIRGFLKEFDKMKKRIKKSELRGEKVPDNVYEFMEKVGESIPIIRDYYNFQIYSISISFMIGISLVMNYLIIKKYGSSIWTLLYTTGILTTTILNFMIGMKRLNKLRSVIPKPVNILDPDNYEKTKDQWGRTQ